MRREPDPAPLRRRLEAAEAERRRLEKALAEVERERRRLRAERDAVGAALREAETREREFVRAVSHDLRTPMTSIRLNAYLLRREVGEGETRRARLQAIDTGLLRMDGMISDLVDAQRIEAGRVRVHPESLAIADFLEELLGRLSKGLDVSRIGTHVPEDVGAVRADSEHLERVLVHLLTNALRYAPEDTPIDLWVEAGEGEVRFSVTDRGPGIPRDLLPRIFERVAHTGDAHGSGLGLGLYVCRGLVEAHGGRIWVESEVGLGSTFRFSLPR